jgi:uncharacterized coiled-coil protein SlyX
MSKEKHSESSSGDKTKKTKLEKIAELQGNLKVVKEENRRLKKEIHQLKVASRGSYSASNFSAEDASFASDYTDGTGHMSMGGGLGNEKLREALRALKRVTVKQELSLQSLRSKARQRRGEIEQRDVKIKELKDEVNALKQAHENLRALDKKKGDEGAVRARLADLELKLARAGSTTTEQSKILEQNKESITTLRDQLEKVKKRPPQREPSMGSLKSTESSISAAEDINRLKRELAKKLEKIVNLEYDLEAAQDEIHELKQKKNFGESSFPATPAPGAIEDFFSDEEDEEEDFWGK